jgi:hypothetical protein
VRKVGRPWRATTRNWKKVTMEPALGWLRVICSRVTALVQHPVKMREMAEVQSM